MRANSYNKIVSNLGVAQLVARYLGVVEAAGSSPVTQTKKTNVEKHWFFFVFQGFSAFFFSVELIILLCKTSSFSFKNEVSTYFGAYLQKVHFTGE